MPPPESLTTAWQCDDMVMIHRRCITCARIGRAARRANIPNMQLDKSDCSALKRSCIIVGVSYNLPLDLTRTAYINKSYFSSSLPSRR
eukprot:425723-Pyramimonas_sp.AAC.2